MRIVLSLAAMLLTMGPASAQCLEVDCCTPCPAAPRCWVRLDYLLWYIDGDEVPLPLVTTGSALDPQPGALNSPNTSVIFGEDALDYANKSGGRFTLGRWLGEDSLLGIELSGFCLETHTIHGAADADRVTGQPVIARPFFNAATGQPDSFVITGPSQPNFNTGGIDVFADSRLWGGEVNGLLNYLEDAGLRFDLIAGFRYLGLKDELRFSGGSEQRFAGQIFFEGQQIFFPAALGFLDFYQTHNHFYGGQLGGRLGLTRGRWNLETTSKLGLGCTHQQLNITGNSVLTVNDPGGVVTLFAPGGHFAQTTNIGYSTRNQFAFTGEFDIRLGFALRRWLSVELGYTFLYWSDVVRPGGAINPVIDSRLAPGRPEYDPGNATANPARIFPSDDFWAQGFSAGLRFQY